MATIALLELCWVSSRPVYSKVIQILQFGVLKGYYANEKIQGVNVPKPIYRVTLSNVFDIRFLYIELLVSWR
jgi:hypothetical protein